MGSGISKGWCCLNAKTRRRKVAKRHFFPWRFFFWGLRQLSYFSRIFVLSGSREIRSRALVNAGGPWVNSVLARIDPAPEKLAIDLVQGTHLVIPGKLQQGMYYLEAPQDQRAIFAMPWGNRILLGTTESLFSGDPSQVQPLDSEIRYLLAVYNHYFDNTLERSQVIDAFAGVRVLPKSEDAAFKRSRDTLLHIDEAN